jgi:hypothetical protein
MNPRYPVVAERAGYRCEYCHAPEVIFNFPFEVEHVVPVSHGGAENESNLALACRACNIHKSSHVTGVDELSGSEHRLFNPRQDSWEAHFRVDADGRFQGLTPEARATILRLRMNNTIQTAARAGWLRLGLFP